MRHVIVKRWPGKSEPQKDSKVVDWIVTSDTTPD